LRIATLGPLFAEPHLDLVLRAIVADNARGRVWAGVAIAPAAALLWDGEQSVYLVGDGSDAAFLGELPGLLAGIQAEAEVAGVRFFKIYTSDVSWEPAIVRLLPAARRRGRILLRRGSDYAGAGVAIPSGCRVVPIDGALLGDGDVGGVEPVREEIGWMWPSLERFLARGFGFAALAGGRVVAWCTAEYVSAGRCGIGIETIPLFQRQGFATATAAAFLAECRARGLVAHWESWLDNLPSVRVAEKLGFERVCAYDVYVAETLRPTG